MFVISILMSYMMTIRKADFGDIIYDILCAYQEAKKSDG